jgi:putative oxidoreductase
MDRVLGIKNTTLDNVVLLASRLLLAAIFVHEGVFLAANFGAAAAGMAKTGVPALALIATIALQLLAGTAIAVGWHARSGAAALGLFCPLTAVLFHTNFANRNELLHFEKDLAIAGGMFVLMLRGAGAYSLDAYAERNRRHDVSIRLANREIATERQTSYDQNPVAARIANSTALSETLLRTTGT